MVLMLDRIYSKNPSYKQKMEESLTKIVYDFRIYLSLCIGISGYSQYILARGISSLRGTIRLLCS